MVDGSLRVSRTKIQQQNYYYHWVDASAGGLLVTDGIIRPVVSALNLNLFVLNATFSNISAISWRPVYRPSDSNNFVVVFLFY
jgi:hypothetical protein